MGFFEDWNKIMESANDDVVDWAKTKVSEHIERFLNDKAMKRDLETLIDKCDSLLLDQYGQKTYYDSLERYVHNGRIRHDIGGNLIVSGFYSTLISVFVYCDDGCRGERRFSDYHLNKMKGLYPISMFGKHGVKKFFLSCYNAFKIKFAIPSGENIVVVNAIKETLINQVDAATQDFRDENRRTQDIIERGLNEIRTQDNRTKNEPVDSQELSEIQIHDDNDEYRKLYQDTLFLETELGDNEKAILQKTYVEPRINFFQEDSEEIFEFEKWVQEDNSRILLLYGKAGIGKTSFVSWLVFEHWLKRECHILKLREYISILNSSSPWKSVKKCFKCENDTLYKNAVLILDGLDEVCVLNREFDGYKFVENLSHALATGAGRNIRIIITSRTGYFNDYNKRDNHVEKVIISWDKTSIIKWCESYCNIHKNRKKWCDSFKNKYEKLDNNDKRKEVFCSPIILYICCVSQIDISEHSSVASIYDKAFRIIGKKEYHAMEEETKIEFEINRQFTKELAFQMFLNGKLEDVLDSKCVKIAKNKTAKWSVGRCKDEDIKLEFKKFFALNHFAFGRSDAVEFAHKTVGEYFTAVKLYEDYFECIFNKMNEDVSTEESAEIIPKIWRSIFNAFRYREIPVDIMNYLVEIIESKQNLDWRSKFFKSYYVGLEQQLLVTFSDNQSEYSRTYIDLIRQIQLSFRNLTWLLTCLKFDNSEFNNTKENLTILVSYIKGDVNLSGWKNLNGINLSMLQLEYARFNGMHLHSASFDKANLCGASFEGTQLYLTNFRETNLEYTSFANSYFFEANFDSAHIKNSTFTKVSGDSIYFNNSRIEYSGFFHVNFKNAHFTHANLYRVHFNETDLKDASLDYARLKNIQFDRAHIEGMTLDDVTFYDIYERNSRGNVEIRHCYLLESDLPKYDKYIEQGDVLIEKPFVETDDRRKEYDSMTNRMGIEEESESWIKSFSKIIEWNRQNTKNE